MTHDQSDTFLRRMLSPVLPEVFFHPVWLRWTSDISNYPPDFVQHVLHNLQLESNPDDLVGTYEVIFMCAYLHSHLGEHATALSSLEQVWRLAGSQGLQPIARYAAWGACAINIRQNSYQEATEWLSKLQETLQEKHEWVLRDILEMFKQNIETRANYDGNGDLSDLLLRWGEWNLPETTNPSQNGERIPQGLTSPISRISLLRQRWSSLWDSVRQGTKRERLPQQLREQGELIHGKKMQREELGPEFEATQSDEEISSATPEVTQAPSEPSNAPVPALQPDTTPSSLPRPYAMKQSNLPSLAVYCLGQFQVYQDEQLVENWLSRKALSVFKYLILEHPTPVVKELLMDTFWPDADLEAARRNLHQAIYALRQILRGEQNEFHHIFFKNDCYSLNPGVETWIDFREFEKCISAGRRFDKAGHLENAMEQYGIAEGLYQGDFLEEDPYEDWPNLRREQLCNSYFGLVDRLSELYLQSRQYTSVIHLCHKVLAKDRCYEAVHRMLMQCYFAQGQRHLAVRQYQTCIRALREDLGIQPSRETVDLYHRIASKHGA